MIRDCYAGNAMAQILSLIMSVFIIVPMVAPALGQGILWVADWRTIFYGMLGLAVFAQLWLSLRQPETLDTGSRRHFSADRLVSAFVEVFRTRTTMGCTIAMSLVFGAFVGYLASAQQVFQEIYFTGDRFALYFAVLAGTLGIASFLNSRIVLRIGMHKLTLISLVTVSIVSVLFLLYLTVFTAKPEFWLLMVFLLACFFPFGILFGNLNALAMEPLGHIAGMGAAVVGSISTLLSVSIGSLVGQMFDGTVLPLGIGFALNLVLALAVFIWTRRQ